MKKECRNCRYYQPSKDNEGYGKCIEQVDDLKALTSHVQVRENHKCEEFKLKRIK